MLATTPGQLDALKAPLHELSKMPVITRTKGRNVRIDFIELVSNQEVFVFIRLIIVYKFESFDREVHGIAHGTGS